MYEDRKQMAMAGWRNLLTQPEIRMTAEEQYDELLKMADAMQQEGLLTGAEWRQLIRDAGAVFTNAREGLEGGT
ncbi:hypothetical protein [Pseudomonas sp. NPDC087336]|jgi:hypothetical protein|uniref:hypothetical protein n=1 Tax=Pseudomonas sp. NPDC087336 TaxID=3364436 RepID=UPI003828BF62